MFERNLDHLVGKEVRVICEECTRKGTLVSSTINWECAMFGRTIYMVGNFIVQDSDHISEIK